MGREKFRKCIQRATKELFPERIKQTKHRDALSGT